MAETCPRLGEQLIETAKAARDVVADKRHRRVVAGIAVVLIGNVIYSAYRASYIEKSSDLVAGFLGPTRGVLGRGEDIYSAYPHNSYAPFFYCVMALLAPFRDGVASVLWSIFSIIFFGCACALLRALSRNSQPGKLAPWFTAPLLAAPILLNNLHLGQSNILPLFLVCCSLYALYAGQDLVAGATLAAAISYKVTPGFFLLYLLLKRRFRALAWTIASLFVWMIVVPVPFFGLVRTLTLVREWAELVLLPFVTGRKVRTENVDWYHTNQSLDAVVHRHLTEYGRKTYAGLHALDPATLSPKQAALLALVLKLGVVLSIVVLANRKRSIRSSQLPFEVALCFLAMLFLSPVSWINHYVVALPAYMLAADVLTKIPKGTARWHAVLWPLAFSVLATPTMVTPQLQSYSPFFFSHAALFVVLWTEGWRENRVAMPA